jgi:hypothetical protein
MCVLVVLFVIGLRLAVLLRIPIPQPRVEDEFSYLLGAETFVSGRVTNPPHPLWEHFETMHELMQPSYMTKYPPGQSAFLALGWKLFGHPWFGVLMSFGLFYGCLCWMLQNWMPPVYAVLGTLVTFAHISIFNYWVNSYWGGAVAASAGCILLGAVARLSGKPKPLDAAVAAAGLVLLANTRPYEGLVMSVAAFATLLYWRKRRKRGLSELVRLRLLIPFLAVLGSGMLLDAYYNYRVTGHPLLMPYSLYTQQYAVAPSFIIFPEHKPPIYRHANLERFWAGIDLDTFRMERAKPLKRLAALNESMHFYISYLYTFPILAAILLGGSFRIWIALFISAWLWAAFCLVNGSWPHYLASGVGLVAVLGAYGFRLLRLTDKKRGSAIVLILVALLCLQVARTERGRDPWVSPRTVAADFCLRAGGKHLILVRYSPEHDIRSEYIYADAHYTLGGFLNDHGAAEGITFMNGATPATSPNDTLWVFTGTALFTTGQTFNVTHDDGTEMYVNGNNVVDQPGPTPPIVTPFTYTGPTGNFSFQFIYTECCFGSMDYITSLVPPTPPTTTPEPNSLMLLSTGLIGLGGLLRRRILAR